HLYGLTDEPLTAPVRQEPPALTLGERAFEVVLARKVAAGETETAWFARHRSTPITELPTHWPGWYRELVERRIELIESDRNVGLVERPEHKRRWSRTPWEDLEQAALRDWLLDKLEDRSLWFNGTNAECRSLAQLADRAAAHPEWGPDWMDVARLWAGSQEVDALTVVTKLVADEHVPAQAAARYKPSGLAKRAEWERVWDLQRAEDLGEDVGKIPVPPKYAQADFLKASYWRQRGKLDVPKERFTSVVGAEKDAASGDGTMVLAWAGFDHAQLAQALATQLFQRQSTDGWSGEELVPLLAALDEVVPRVEQWHPE
ncbi:MAG: BREX-2 system adenine-specific DNA-methyltransferase PglX, partial [Xanthomonadales bacterium]|nr:BREX-2 system adenine-specific DNA-methyltransferase PglX [Xanthomonadales bacterium]